MTSRPPSAFAGATEVRELQWQDSTGGDSAASRRCGVGRGVVEGTQVTTVPDGALGLSRRELLRRGAALGAALTVATPVVQSLGAAAAFAQESPPPPASVPSHIQLLVTFASDPQVRGVKFDEGEGWSALFRQGNKCWDPTTEGYQGATKDQVAYLNANASVLPSASGYRVTLPELVAVVDAAATYDGSNCFDLDHPDGPYQDGAVWVFPKPPGGQGGGN
jgi:hypothetical protein